MRIAFDNTISISMRNLNNVLMIFAMHVFVLSHSQKNFLVFLAIIRKFEDVDKRELDD